MYTVLVPSAKTACRLVLKFGLPFITNFTQTGHEGWVKYFVLIVPMRLWLFGGVGDEKHFLRLQRTPEAKLQSGPVHALKCIAALKVWLEKWSI